MAEQAKRAKINRKSKLGAFTRKHNHVQALVDGGAEREVLEKQYEELAEVFKEVENAHQELCMHLEEDDDDADESYLDEPSSRLSSIHVVRRSLQRILLQLLLANLQQKKRNFKEA